MSLQRTSLLLALAACLAPSPGHAAETRAFVVTTDFSSGSLSVVDLASRAVTRDVEPVYSDARVRWFDGLVYVINRFGQDNIQVVDPATYATVRQFSVGNGSNPQDICVVSPTKAYVTRLASPRLLIVNPATGDSVGAISLAPFADADGVPDMDRMIRLGSRLFVSLGRLANFAPTDSSLVAVIDVAADTVVDCDPARPGAQGIRLAATNPVTPFAHDAAGGRLLIGCAGRYGANDGGVAVVDPATLGAGGLAITESALGGDVLDVVWRSATRSFAIVSDPSYNTSAVVWNPATGQTSGTLFAPGGFSLADIALDDRDELYVCDNDFTAPGVFVFDAATGALLAGPLDTGLPPFEIAFDGPPVAASAPLATGAALRLSAPWPQPARDGARLALELPAPAEVRADLYDAGGRHVRTLASGRWSAGRGEIAWDGCDAAGAPARAGVYLVRVRAGSVRASRSLVVLH